MHVRQLLKTFVETIHAFHAGPAGDGTLHMFRPAATSVAPQDQS